MLLADGLNIADFHVLVALRDQPLSQLAIARTLQLDPAAVSRLVGRAVRDGNIVPVSKGPRSEWRLSHYGMSLLEVLSIPWESVDGSIRRFLGNDLVSGLLHRAAQLPPRHREPTGAWRD